MQLDATAPTLSRNKTVKPFGLADKLSYMMGDFGCNMSFALVLNYFMLFYVTMLGINPFHFSIIILATKIWDGINDPLIGALTDFLKPKEGRDKFRPWIFWASFPITIATVLLFAYVPNAPYWAKLTLCIISYLVWDICYTCINVPYGSLQSVITSDPVERAELSRYRSFGAFVVQIGVMYLIPKFVFAGKDPIGINFTIVAGAMAILGFIAFQILYRFSVERIRATQDEQEIKYNFFKTVGAFFKNRPMMALTLSTMAQLFLVASTGTMNQYVFMTYYKTPGMLSYGALLSMGPTLIAMIFVKQAVKRFGKKNLTTWPILLSSLCYLFLLLVPVSGLAWFIIQGVAALLAGFWNMLIWAIVSDCIDYQEMQTGRREEGSIYATYSLFRKFAQGFGASLIALLIGVVGYQAKLGADQLPGVADGIRRLAALLPLAGNIIIFLSMLFIFNLDNKNLKRLEEQLAARRAGSKA